MNSHRASRGYAATGLVSVLVSFVVVRLGSGHVVAGLVEHGADADDRA
jgi:ABC-type thiamin/hydroxymethylpyrimidine transport system permease subunit